MRGHAQHLVASRVSETVVDLLEVVQVNTQQREGGATLGPAPGSLLQHLVEAGPVQRATERVVVSHVTHAGIDLALPAQAHPELVAGQRQQHQQPCRDGTGYTQKRAFVEAGAFGLVRIHLDHAKHLAITFDRHIGLAVNARVPGPDRAPQCHLGLAGQHRAENQRVRLERCAAPLIACRVMGSRSRHSLEFVRRQDRRAGRVQQFKVKNIVGVQQTRQLLARRRRHAPTRKRRFEVGHGALDELCPAHGRLCGVLFQLVFGLGSQHPAQTHAGERQAKDP